MSDPLAAPGVLSTASYLGTLFAAWLVAVLVTRGAAWDAAFAGVDRIARRRSLAIATCAVLAFFGSMLVATLVAWPEPRVHDEFSYLLAADTFAHGRLANPTHPLWQHFETFHVFHVPTYASKYPPAQGLLLALGTVLTGEPAGGLWIGGALLAASLCWMLYGLVSPRWAFLGGLVATAEIGVGTYWTQSFWGGAVAASGAALVFGAAARLGARPRVGDALWLGVGLVVLANSRPFEGAVTSLAAAGLLAFSWWRRGRVPRDAVLSLGAVLVVGAAAMAVYDRAVTGSAWLPPYLHHERLYVVQPPLNFQAWRPPPQYRHEAMARFYAGTKGAGPAPAEAAAGPAPTAEGSTRRALGWKSLAALHAFFVGRTLSIPLLVGLLAGLSDRRFLMLTAAAGLAAGCLFVTPYFQIHYVAPVAAPIFAWIALGLERIERLQWRRLAVGRAFCLVALGAAVASAALQIRRAPEIRTGSGTDDFCARREAVVETLRTEPGRDLVVVEYGDGHDVHREWVYNAADIDGADVVWARSMGPAADRELLAHFPDRRVWLYRDGFGKEADGLRPYAP